jgi:hypothetical protein
MSSPSLRGFSPNSSHRLYERVVHIAVHPILSGLERLDDVMAGVVMMLRGVAVLRVVAASDVTAETTQPQVNPIVTDLQTFLTSR